MKKKHQIQKGFTLIELIVVTGIIVLLTALILPQYRVGERRFALQRSAHLLAQDIRKAQEMAMSGKELPGAPATFRGAYGIKFQTNSSNYILFADLDDDQVYDVGEEVGDPLELEKNVKISNLSPTSPLTVIFIPPDPTVVFQPDANAISITIEAEGLEGAQTIYTYQFSRNVWGWRSPRAGCDVCELTRDCPISFPASPEDPRRVYDRWQLQWWHWTFNRSRRYVKQETTVVAPPQKTIQVNKAGLIYVE